MEKLELLACVRGNEPGEVSLSFQGLLASRTHQLHKMLPTTPPLDFDHKPGFEIQTKHKEAIRQLYGFGKKSVEELIKRYSLSKTTIIQILGYPAPERTRPTRTGRPQILTDTRVNEVIEYLLDT